MQDPTFSADTAGTRAALANAEVRAPFPGVITDLNLKVGEFAASGQPVITVADNTQWVVKTTDLTEIDVVKIKEGQPVTVTLDALPGVELNGNVFSISNNYLGKPGRRGLRSDRPADRSRPRHALGHDRRCEIFAIRSE